MAKLALVLSVIALAISVLAYREAVGTHSLQKALETARQETADALARIERALRPADDAGQAAPKPKP